MGPPRKGLKGGNVRRLQTLGPAGHFKFDGLAFVQRFVPIPLNCGEVHKNVFAGLALNKPKTLAGIEPLYCSLFSHGISLFLELCYLAPFIRFLGTLIRNTKKAASVTCSPFNNEIQRCTRASNAASPYHNHIRISRNIYGFSRVEPVGADTPPAAGNGDFSARGECSLSRQVL
jgi:hypothetical protein